MVAQENVTKVVSLCEKMGDEVEGIYKEACQYFPTDEANNLHVVDQEGNCRHQVILHDSKTVRDEFCVRRFFEVVTFNPSQIAD